MAKISTYPPVSSPSLSDLLIGTEVTNNNATVNFSISDILALGSGLYVPYTGANANVDLGTFTLSSGGADFFGPVYLDDALLDSTGSPGTIGQILSSTVTGTQWIDLSALSVNLQQVLDDGNTADQNIILTGASNKFEQTGSNAFINQTGATAFISQLGATAFISQTGLNAYISQSGNNGTILQTGTDSLIQQQGLDAIIRQIGANARILQTGSDNYISQTGANAYIEQQGLDAYIKQIGDNATIEQTGIASSITQIGANAFISQAGSFAYIEQTGTNASIRQTNANAYMEPSQIKDGAASYGTAGQVLSSLGPGAGLEWISPLTAVNLGSFYDTTIQTTTVGVARPMKFGSDDIVGLGVSVTADGLGNRTQIVVAEAGIYNIQFSAQLRNGAGASVIDIWFRNNGGNLAHSNTSVSLQANTNEVASWNYFVSLVPGDIFQIMWTQDNNNATLFAAAAAAPHPETPSVILTVNRVR